MSELRALRETERWLAWIRVVGVAFAAFQRSEEHTSELQSHA